MRVARLVGCSLLLPEEAKRFPTKILFSRIFRAERGQRPTRNYCASWQ